MFQLLLHDGVRHGISSQRGRETQETLDRADDVGQSVRPLRQRRVWYGDTASVHVHRLHVRRLARQTALCAATSRSILTLNEDRNDDVPLVQNIQLQ